MIVNISKLFLEEDEMEKRIKEATGGHKFKGKRRQADKAWLSYVVSRW